MKQPLLVVAALLAVASLWWIQAPPRTAEAYRERAARDAELLVSHVQTARLWAEGRHDDEVTPQAATVGLHEAEKDATKVASDFESHTPPPGQEGLRDAYSRLSADARAALGRLRIASTRDNWTLVVRERDSLAELAERLEAFATGARR